MSLGKLLSRWWLKFPLVSLKYKKLAYRHLSRSGENQDIPFVSDFYGLRYEGNLANGIEFAIYFYGAFEKPLLFFLRDVSQVLEKNSDEPLCFCDIGSNVGQHTLFMSQHAAVVHAFEPYKPVRERLAHHIALNQLQNISIHAVGLGAADEELNFFAPTGSNQGIGTFVDKVGDTAVAGGSDIGKLKVVQADSYFETNHIPSPKLIKIDVEGFERAVLEGAANLLAENRPVLVCEITYGEQQSFQSLNDLQQALPEDYLIYHFDIRKPNGQTDRRRGSRAKRSGAYLLRSLDSWRDGGQDDIVAVPKELAASIPLHNP